MTVDGRECEMRLQERIGYGFHDSDLLRDALTHKSFSNEQPGKAVCHNERLEFLGDAVLDLVVSDLLFRHCPDLPEGELSRIRAEIVNEGGLATVGRQIGLGKCLRFGKGEERSGGRDKDSLIADALEAVLGAVFRDGGFEAVARVVETLFLPFLRISMQQKAGSDYKTRLQELLQGRWGRPPEYLLVDSQGPDHDRTYFVEVRFDAETIGRGEGKTKKGAEQMAARRALERLEP